MNKINHKIFTLFTYIYENNNMKLDLSDLGTGGKADKIIREMTFGKEEIWYDKNSSEVRYRLNFKTGEKYERTIPLSMISEYVKNQPTNSK